jgi:hypothetical protein
MTTPRVEVRGLRELSSAFRKVDGEIPKELQREFKGIAQAVVDQARPKVPRKSGKAAGSIKPRATQKGAGIAFGGSAAPYYPWLDFGGGKVGVVGIQRGGSTGASKRPVVKGGRYVYPAIMAMKDETTEAVDKAVKHAADRAGFDTEGSL